LVLILKNEGIWTQTCTEIINATSTQIEDCTDETGNYAMIATVAILTGNIMSLPLGVILDKFGTLPCRVACTLCITLGKKKYTKKNMRFSQG